LASSSYPGSQLLPVVLKSPPTLCTTTHLLPLATSSSTPETPVVDDVAQDTRIGEPHSPREMGAVGPVHSVVVVWKNAQRFWDASPAHALYVIHTQLLHVLTGTEVMNWWIPRVSNARLSASRLSSARGIVGR